MYYLWIVFIKTAVKVTHILDMVEAERRAFARVLHRLSREGFVMTVQEAGRGKSDCFHTI